MQLWYEFENHFLLELLQSQTCPCCPTDNTKKGRRIMHYNVLFNNISSQIFPSHTQTRGFPPKAIHKCVQPNTSTAPSQSKVSKQQCGLKPQLAILRAEKQQQLQSEPLPTKRTPHSVSASCVRLLLAQRTTQPSQENKRWKITSDCGHCRKLCKQMTESLFSPKLLTPQKWTRTQQYQIYFDAFVGNLTWLENN